MIKTYYGNSIYADIKKALEEKGLADKVYVHEPNKSGVVTMLQNGTCPMPCVTPYIESKYIISSSFDTYTTVGADGEKRIHTFDFQNSMPVVLNVYFTVLTFSIPELEEIESCLSERYSQPCTLSWTGLPEEDDTFSFVLSLDKTKDIQRSGNKQRLQGELKDLYQSIFYAKVALGVEITKPYSAVQIDLDNELQLRLVKRIKVLDTMCAKFAKKKAELAAAPAAAENESAIKFIDYALSVIPNVREELRTSLKIPADCAQPEMIMRIAEIIEKEKCSVKTVLERIVENRRKKAAQAAQQEKAAAARNEQIHAVKFALDHSTRIEQLQEQIKYETTQSYSPRPTAPVKQNVPPPVYPPIKANVPFFTKEKMIKGIFGGGNLFGDHEKEVKAEEERIRNSPEYQQQCAAIDEAYQKRVAFAEEQYQANLKQYQEVILPRYEQGFSAWQRQHEEKLTAFKTELEQLEKELAEHYAATQIVPVQYRKIDALSFIYDAMRDPDYSFTAAQAANMYDQAVRQEIERRRREEEQRRAEAEEARLEAEERAAWAAEEAAEAARRAEQTAAINAANVASANTPPKKKDYYRSPACRRMLGGASECSRCTLAPMCRRAERGR